MEVEAIDWNPEYPEVSLADNGGDSEVVLDFKVDEQGFTSSSEAIARRRPSFSVIIVECRSCTTSPVSFAI